MSKQTKLERLEQEAADTKAAMDAHLAQRNDLAVEGRALQARLREPNVPALERLEANARLKEIDRQLDRLRANAGSLSDKKEKAASALFEAKKSLAEAERVLRMVEDPPEWVNPSPGELQRWKQHAESVVKELMRR